MNPMIINSRSKQKNRRFNRSLIQKLKGSDWNKIYKQTEDIREHNRKTFWTKSYLSNLVNKELLRWFEFFDSSQVSS
jgi:REP element-mobilizing transposase RayT